jgi:hypothetical protein
MADRRSRKIYRHKKRPLTSRPGGEPMLHFLVHFKVKVNACEAVNAAAALGLPLLPVDAATLTL